MDPRRSRPRFPPGYGVPGTPEGMLEWTWATERLAAARNYWIVTSSADGGPHAAPVWGLWIDAAVVFSTSPESSKGRNFVHDPRVVVHLESGDEVVIVEGEVETIGLDDRIADAYQAKYDSGNPEPLWYRVPPRVVYAWLESSYPRSVTRFFFD
jgi:Pyridoxamine 5'-phosphate oxidase